MNVLMIYSEMYIHVIFDKRNIWDSIYLENFYDYLKLPGFQKLTEKLKCVRINEV